MRITFNQDINNILTHKWLAKVIFSFSLQIKILSGLVNVKSLIDQNVTVSVDSFKPQDSN